MPVPISTQDIRKRIEKLGQWFHNIDLNGVQTAPHHFLGDYPSLKWRRFEASIPADPSGKTALDIGCNAGFYSMQLKRRGAARVLGIDSDPAYLEQAHFAAEVTGTDIEFRLLDVYDVAKLRERFDIVLFMGVLYHLRHPLLALDLLHEHVVKDILVFHSLLRGSPEIAPLRSDYPFAEKAVFDQPGYPVMHFVEERYSGDNTNWWIPIGPARKRCCGVQDFKSSIIPKTRCLSASGGCAMVEAVMLWNEPNNLSHWNFELDPDWAIYARMVKLAAKAVYAENKNLLRVLGGISPIDPRFIQTMDRHGVLSHVDVIAVHGFPLDWNHWSIHDWPAKLEEVRAVSHLPVWVSEVGVSTFGAEEVQVFGLQRTAELLIGRTDRIHWCSLYDLPRAWPATTRHLEAEGSSYYRHFYMGLVREDGTPKQALRRFYDYSSAMGICQWFHYQDHRLEPAVRLLKELGVRSVRTGISWADSFRPDAEKWFDCMMKKLEPFDLTITFCLTPEHCGLAPNHTSPPQDVGEFAEFCARMVRRYAN